MPTYAVTFTRVVEVEQQQPLDPSGRPPKHLWDWDQAVLEAVTNAAVVSINDTGLENIEADQIVLMDDEDGA